jgi:leucyl aminopeptidase
VRALILLFFESVFYFLAAMLATQLQPGSIPVALVSEDKFDAWRTKQSGAILSWANANAFHGERGKVLLAPDLQGKLERVLVGLGKGVSDAEVSLWHASGLYDRIPEGSYHLATALPRAAAQQFALGWLYGQYHFGRYRRPQSPRESKLYVPDIDIDEMVRLNSACTLARDLINTPANDLTPEQLAEVAVKMAQRYGAVCRHYRGDEVLTQGFPAVHAVGRASVTAPQLIDFTWGEPHRPRVTLVGKGVCFDSGGLDIKPPSSMLLMKKDMGGAACVLALAQAVMDAQLPIRLRVIIPAVENAIAGNAFRPGDVLATRKGLTVEVGNTDAEGRLILCDALALADEEEPELLIDLATLTGAARVALGPELPAVFTNNEALVGDLIRVAKEAVDHLWLLPLWSGYDDELASKIADLNNVSPSGFSGAIIGGLFLKRFVSKTKQWVHIDMYGWNAKDRPGRPVGAEPQCVRALYAYLRQRYVA